jgi:hypothetical protein
VKKMGGRNARFRRLGKDFFSQMARATPFDTVERGVDLIRTIDGDINHGILLYIAQGKVSCKDELFGLEACGASHLINHSFFWMV